MSKCRGRVLSIEDVGIKGYFTNFGYNGWVPWLNRYIRFASQEEYFEYLEEAENE